MLSVLTRRIIKPSFILNPIRNFQTVEFGDKTNPHVIVVQEWWGLNDEIKNHAKYISEQGFYTIIPDLYNGKTTIEIEEANHLMDNLNFPKAIEEIDQLLGKLRVDNPQKKVGIVGICMGSVLAIASAINCSHRIDVAAGFYGIPPKQLADASKIKCPLLYQMGEKDNTQGFSDPATTDTFQAAVIAAGNEFEIYRYPNVGHAFLNKTEELLPARKKMGFPDYDPQVAKLAWQRLFTFLNKHLQTV